MPDEPKPPIDDDRERLQRYLEWRERSERPAQRAVRRRRVRGALAGAAVGLIGVAILAWLSSGARQTALIGRQEPPSADAAGATAAAAAPDVAGASEPRPASLPTAPPQIERVPAAPPLPNVVVRRTARANVRIPARTPAPDGARAEPAPAASPDRATTSDLAASAAPADVWRESMPDVRRAPQPRVDTAMPSAAPPLADAPSPTDLPSPMARKPVAVSPGDGVTPAGQPCSDMDMDADSSPDGRTRSQRVADCVGGWLKGESRQFRDGVKRGVDEFRAGVDKVGRGLEWLGGKLRRSE